MKLKNKLFFNIFGLSFVSMLPIIVASCSKDPILDSKNPEDATNDYLDNNKPLPNISIESNNKLNNLWVTDTTNNALNISKLGTSLVDKLNSTNLQNKTKEEVQKIANNNFNQLNNETLKEIMFNTFNATSMYGHSTDKIIGVTQTAQNKFLYDVQKLEFNKVNSEVSFEYVMSIFQRISTSDGNTTKSCGIAKSIVFKFSNLKIESFVREIDWNKKTKLLPSIRISTNQPNAKLELVDYKILGDENDLRQFAEFVYDIMPSQPNDKPKPPKEEFINHVLNGENTFRYYKKEAEALKQIGNKFGTVNGTFTVKENFPNFSISTDSWDYNQIAHLTSMFNTLGYQRDPNSSVEKLIPSALNTNSVFAYSEVKNNNNVQWEIYELNQ